MEGFSLWNGLGEVTEAHISRQTRLGGSSVEKAGSAGLCLPRLVLQVMRGREGPDRCLHSQARVPRSGPAAACCEPWSGRWQMAGIKATQPLHPVQVTSICGEEGPNLSWRGKDLESYFQGHTLTKVRERWCWADE